MSVGNIDMSTFGLKVPFLQELEKISSCVQAPWWRRARRRKAMREAAITNILYNDDLEEVIALFLQSESLKKCYQA